MYNKINKCTFSDAEPTTSKSCGGCGYGGGGGGGGSSGGGGCGRRVTSQNAEVDVRARCTI